MDKMMSRRLKTLEMIFKPANLPKLFILLAIIAVLYYVYTTYLKEGLENPTTYETNPQKFDQDVLSGNNRKLVLFYAGWCGHCHQLMPEWDKAAKNTNGNKEKSEWAIYKVNVGGDKSPSDATSEQEELGKKYSIKGYPTILIFQNGKLITEYEGPRSEEGFKTALSS